MTPTPGQTDDEILAQLAPEGSEMRAYMDLLLARGCEFALRRYPNAGTVLHLVCRYDSGKRSRLMFTDKRCLLQLKGLLTEMNAPRTPNTLLTPETMAAEALAELKGALTYD